MTWFRFTVKRLQGESDTQVMLSHFGLFDAEHNDVALGITYNPAANGHVKTTLRPGQAAFETSDCWSSTDANKVIDNLFKPYVENMTARWSRNSQIPDPSQPDTCPSLVIRLPANVTAPVVAYDMISGWFEYGVIAPFHSAPIDWTLEGSVDGVNWEPVALDSKTGWTTAGSGNNYWLSDATVCTGIAAGFPISTSTGAPSQTLALGALSVAPLATLSVTGSASVSELDLASGAGTLSGVSFADTGTLKVVIPPEAGYTYSVPCALQDCTGLANLKKWALLVNGEPAEKWAFLRATEDEVFFSRAGFAIFVR